MKVLALVSGGKDSVAAIHVARQHGWDVVGACVIRVVGEDSHMFHRPNIRWARLVAEAIGLQTFVQDTNGDPESELDDLKALLRTAAEATGADGIISGALASEYQRTRIDRIGHQLGLRTFAPLWHKPQGAYVRSLVRARFHIHMSAVATEGLGRGWLGRKLTARALDDLERQSQRFRFHIAGEGGEYETLVTDGPDFIAPVEIGEAVAHWHRDAGDWEVLDAKVGHARSPGVPVPELPPE